MIGIHKLAITDNTDTLQMPVILDGGEDATRAGLTIETEGAEILNGQLFRPYETRQLQLAGLFDNSQTAQIQSWVDSQTPLTFAGIGTGLVFRGSGILNAEGGFNDNIASWKVLSAARTVKGFSGGRLINPFMLSPNGFNDVLWQDSGDGTAEGWNIANGSGSFSNGEQTITADEENVKFERTLFLPVITPVTFSVEIVSTTNASNLTGREVKMEYRNQSAVVIGQDITSFTGSGIKQVTGTPPEATISITFKLRIEESSGDATSSDLVCKNPSFRIDNSTKYIAR